jgi:hypothetical protein
VQGASNGSAVGVAQISYNGLASAGLGAGTDIGYLRFTDQGSNSGVFAQITATADATTGAGDYPGRLVFSTTADGGSSPSERLRITSSGNVGIGTSSPGQKLDVNGEIVCSPNTAGKNTFQLATNAADDASLIMKSNTTTKVNIQANGTSYFNGGNVGIGTSSPANLLHINGGSQVTPALKVQSAIYPVIDLYSDFGGEARNWRIAGVYNSAGTFEILSSTTAGGEPTTSRFAINSSGNVGIGTTAPTTPLSVRAVSNIPTYGNVSANFSDNTTGTLYISHSSGVQGLISDGTLAFGSGGSGTERARIDTSGRLLVGTSTARDNFYNSTLSAGLQLEGAGTARRASILGSDSGGALILGYTPTPSIDNATGAISFQGYDGSEFVECANIVSYIDSTPGANDMPGRLVFSVTAAGAASPTERMRISNTGRTVLLESSGGGFEVASTLAAGTDNLFTGYYGATNTTTKGTASYAVRTNGNVLNTNNSYGALSDIKLKENIVDANSQWDDLKALQVRKYNFKEETGQQTHTQIGLVAQEVELVSPGLVSESPDRDAEGNDLGTVTKSVNYSVLYMKAVKALQEAMERIEQLEAKVAALDAA